MCYRKKITNYDNPGFCFQVILICSYISTICSESTITPTISCPDIVAEGDSLSCECDAPLGFSPETVSLFWGNQPERSATLSKKSVNRHDNGTVYTCEMAWDGRKTAVNYTLRVAYGPDNVTISGPSSFITNGSQAITLRCEATNTYPDPNLFWGNVKCDTPSPAELCAFTPRKEKDDGQNISCTANNKIFTNKPTSATTFFSLHQQYPPDLPPQLTNRRSHNDTIEDIVTCTVTGGKPMVSKVHLSCNSTVNSTYFLVPPASDQENLVSSSLAFPLVQSQVVVCTCRGVWAPQEDMYPYVVTATYSFKQECRTINITLPILVGCLSILAAVAVAIFFAGLFKRIRSDKKSPHNESDSGSQENERISSNLRVTFGSKQSVNHSKMTSESIAVNSSSNLYHAPTDREGCHTDNLSSTVLLTEAEGKFQCPSVEVDHSEAGLTPRPLPRLTSDKALTTSRPVEKPDSERDSHLYSSLDSDELKHGIHGDSRKKAVPYAVVDVCQQPKGQHINIEHRERTKRIKTPQLVETFSSIRKETVGADKSPRVSSKPVSDKSDASEYNVLRVSSARSLRISDYQTPPIDGSSDQGQESYSNLWRDSKAGCRGHRVESGDGTVISGNTPSLRSVIIDVINPDCNETQYDDVEDVQNDAVETKDDTHVNAYDEVDSDRVSISVQEIKEFAADDADNVYESLDGTGRAQGATS